jgi:hypothetical protein
MKSGWDSVYGGASLAEVFIESCEGDSVYPAWFSGLHEESQHPAQWFRRSPQQLVSDSEG